MNAPRSLAIATAVTNSALALTLAAPMAHADPVVDSIANTVKNDRARYGSQCPALTYSPQLEGIASKTNGNYPSSGADAQRFSADYPGQMVAFRGWGDPEAAAVNATYKNGAGAALSNCDYTEFGASFWRSDIDERDYVTIVFGKPAAAPKPAEAPKPADVPIPAEPAKPVEPPAATPVTNAIQLSFGPATGILFVPEGGSITATIKNSSDLTASCHYSSTPGGLTDQDFSVGPKGSTDLPFTGTRTGTTYHAVVSCHDASGQQPQEIGHAEKDVKF
jgi:hypothetical protein